MKYASILRCYLAGAFALVWSGSASATTVSYSYSGSMCQPADWSMLDPNSGVNYTNNHSAASSYELGSVVVEEGGEYGEVVCHLVRHAGFSHIVGAEFYVVGSNETISCVLIASSGDGSVLDADSQQTVDAPEQTLSFDAIDAADYQFAYCDGISPAIGMAIIGLKITEAS